jgi:hypothetical protein
LEQLQALGLGKVEFHPGNSNGNERRRRRANSSSESLKIGALNVRRLATTSEARLIELQTAVSQVSLDVLALSELRYYGTGSIDLNDSNYRLFHAGPETADSTISGTGFLVHKRLQHTIQEFKSLHPRMSQLTIKYLKKTINLVAIYAPAAASEEEYENFLQQVELHSKAPNTILLGDFNAKVGQASTAERSVGAFGGGDRNVNGELLVQFCEKNSMKIGNTFFKHREGRSWTWRSPGGRTHNMIDYIIYTKRWSQWINNVSVVSQFSFETDHRLVRATLHLTRTGRVQKRTPKRKVRHIHKETFNLLVASAPPRTDYEDLRRVLEEAAEGAELEQRRVGRVSLHTKELMRRRLGLLQQREHGAARVLGREIRGRMKADLEAHRFELFRRVVSECNSLKKVQAESAIGRKRITQIRRSEESPLETSVESMSAVVKDFYESLYTSRVQVPFTPKTETDECPIFLEAELREALKTMQAGKAPGEDGITVEMLKAAKETLLPVLTDMLNRYLVEERIDDHLADTSTLLLYKKGDDSLLKNYRPISLLSAIAKLFTRTICNRIKTTMEGEQGEEQAGFRAGFSTIEHIATICELIERCKEFHIPLYLCFVDFEKAFDSVELNALWRSMQSQGVHPQLIRLLQNIYSQAKNIIRLNVDQRVEVKIQRGVRQGDPISPMLFNAALEDIFRRLDWQDGGITINGEHLTHLRFADDIVLISTNREEMQRRLQELSKAASGSGLKINEGKTEWIGGQEDDPADTLTLNGKEIKKTTNFVYLGRQVSSPLNLKGELARRTRAGWFAFSKLSSYLTARRVPMKHKRYLYNMCVLPAMLYACETWAPTAHDMTIMEVAQRRIERRMAGITLYDRWTNERLRRRTGVADIVEEIRRRKNTFAWQVARKPPSRWIVQVMSWYPREGRRGAGRPRRRWQDDLGHRAGGRNWMRVAREMSLDEWLLL